MQFAAIDIGSNAIRLLISNVFENKDNTVFKKYSLTRIPIRLGEDAFLTGKISETKAERVVKAMNGIFIPHRYSSTAGLPCLCHLRNA